MSNLTLAGVLHSQMFNLAETVLRARMSNLTLAGVLHSQMFNLAETVLRARCKNPFGPN